ncbi:MAG: hypothetical protein V3U35_00820 [Candidatus Neomarinimicrobiota bacterium]
MVSSLPSRVFHTRLADFPVHAERLLDSSLAAKALAVVSSPRQNGTIVALSREAVEEGLRRHMRVSLARKISRRTVLLPANSDLYHKVQALLYGRLSRYSPAVEAAGYGQFFLDMTGMERMFATSEAAGHALVQDLSEQVNLVPRIGISRNKLVSAIATRVAPGEPVLAVPSGQESRFLAPLRSSTLPIARERPVGQSLRDLNLVVVRDVQGLVGHPRLGQMVFQAFFRQVSAQARGIDTSVVQPRPWQDRGGGQIMERYILPEETNDEGLLLGALQHLTDVVGYKLRRLQCLAEEVQLLIHYTDGYEQRATGRIPLADSRTVGRHLRGLYQRAGQRRNRVRALTVVTRRLKPYADQLSLFDVPGSRSERVSRQVDIIRAKYGVGSILTAGQFCLES